MRRKLIEIAPIEIPQEQIPDRKLLEVAMLWRYLAAAPYAPGGEPTCDATAMVDPWPHQRRVVEDAAHAFPAGRLLCDEVGMGKTLEAILILRRLLCGRGVKRALLLVPAGLLQQWQDELREKGGLLVPRWDNGVLYEPGGKKRKIEAADALANCPLLLLSREWARIEENRSLVLNSAPFDIALLDEAHAARRKAPEETGFNSVNLLLQLLREMQLRKRVRGILLLSATPMQTEPWEPWDLLSVLGVGGAWMADFGDIRRYYDGIASLNGAGATSKGAREVARLAAGDAGFPLPPGGLKYQDAKSLQRGLIFATPDRRRRYAEWLRRGAPLGRYMHRNTRDTLRAYHQKGLLAQPPPERQVEDVLFDYTDPAEREVYDAVASYINDRYDQLEHQKRGKGFVMTIYRRRASSSPLALRRSLERRIDGLQRVIRKQHTNEWLTAEDVDLDARDLGDEDMDLVIDSALPANPKEAEAELEKVVALQQRLNALGATDSKLGTFFEVLQQITADGRAVLVFTEYTDTMEYLRDHLRPHYGSTLGCYRGAGGLIWSGSEWKTTTKAEITERLGKGEMKVLVCTDAASEGLNLQAASALIQYDLPWNPSKCEQRIGRIDRIGQKASVLPIRNLFLRNSVDMLVYQALQRRCGLFEHFVGPMQPVLAFARDALRSNLRPDQAGELIQKMDKLADKMETDEAANNTYLNSEADALPEPEAPVTRGDYAIALQRLREARAPVKVTPIKGSACWQITGLGRKAVTVTPDRESLERDREMLPLTAGAEMVTVMAGKLPLPANQVPLVFGEYQSGGFRSVEIRWLSGSTATPVNSFAHLLDLLRRWDGSPPSPSLLVKAQAQARKDAQRRVIEMAEHAEAEEKAGLERQLTAARARLKRELARTLRCLGSGDLNAILHAQLKNEGSGGRYHRALNLLGGFGPWTPEEIEDAATYIAGAPSKDWQARVNLASGVEAALNDPRWMAAVHLKVR